MNRFRYLLIFFFLISSHALHSQLRIEITEGIEDPIKIALVPIKWNIDLPQKHYFHEVMKQDLESFGEFNVLEPNGMLSLPYNEEEVFFRDWRLLGVDFLVIGEANRIEQSEEIVISYIIFDVIREKAIHRANIHGSIKSIRKISHNISDKIYSKVKGISGIFSTRLAYIDKPSSLDKNYNLRISDIDGFNDTILFSSSQPLMSPSWSPKGDRLAYVSFEEGTSRIFIQEIPTAKRRGLKLEIGINSSPNWSPRGDKLAAVLSRDGNPNIYLYDLKKNTWKQVTDHFGIDTEPDWELFQHSEIVEQLFHIHDHFNIVSQMKPQSVEQLAMVLAIIRPAKRSLLGESWQSIQKQVWLKPIDNSYYFKKSHAMSYALAIVVQLNLLVDSINFSN